MTQGGGVIQPFGTIVVLDLGIKRSVWPDARVGHVPWSSKCLLINEHQGISAAALAFASLLRPCPTILRVYSATDISATSVLAAIRNRQPPTAHEVSEYVYERTRSTELAMLLGDFWEPESRPLDSPTGSNIDRIARRALRRYGTLSPCDWRRVAVLTRTERTANRSVAWLANAAGVDLRSLRSWTRRLLGVSARGWKELAGWEWMVEAALRQGRFVGQFNDPVRLVPAGLQAGVHWRAPGRVRHSGGLVRPVVAKEQDADLLESHAEDQMQSERAG